MWNDAWDHWQYLALMGACLLITLPLEFVLRARVYRRPRRLLLALAPVVVLFSAWDVLGIVRDHWSYAEQYTTGALVPGLPMPVEELTFFVVIPICGLLTYEAVGTVLGWVRGGWVRRGRSGGAPERRADGRRGDRRGSAVGGAGAPRA